MKQTEREEKKALALQKERERMHALFSYEREYGACSYICGIDEVGRGPLAGPVVATAVIMPKGCYIEGVTDSKKLSEKKRKALKEEIEKKALSVATVFISEEEIDEINIYEASRLAMTKAIKGLTPKPDIVLSDAMPLHIDIETLPIIKGDQLSFTIGCASIIAKVIRDDYMDLMDKKYPEYDFKSNKGYGTKKHIAALNEYGITDVHRRSYEPVKSMVNEQLQLDL